MKLLVADDEFIILQGILSMDWKAEGFEQVLSAQNGQEARELLEREEIDIIISDIRMPGLSGLELAGYIREYQKSTMVILLTGFSDFQYAQEAIRQQVYDYILKPIKTDELAASVRRAVSILEQKRYSRKVVREHEDMVGAFDASEQILYSFRVANPQVMDMLTYIAQNYSGDITLNALAEQYHFTAIYLSRLIKRETGYSFVDILTGIRLMNAGYLLKENKQKINMICDRTGFHDSRYFSQVFKRIFDSTPGEYRKNPGIQKDYSIREILDMMDRKK
ncbi:response regulator transcription factor [Robinsoniella peoriensis]|uniref:response regulator transcription factor n=1 Tax=Robinsoniella peoriensis TaxID=180332 RepID=UPI00085C093D|nr:response regulator [Robinsoniella peoriensis]